VVGAPGIGPTAQKRGDRSPLSTNSSHRFRREPVGGAASKISQAIGVAVAQALTDAVPGTAQTDFLSLCRISGGKRIDVTEATRLGLEGVLADRAGAAGARVP